MNHTMSFAAPHQSHALSLPRLLPLQSQTLHHHHHHHHHQQKRPISYTPKFRCSVIESDSTRSSKTVRTCKNCKTQFDPSLNHPRACRFHPAHFGGETKRKFESVYSGGTMDTPDSGRVFQYWHCCGSEDPFDPGCTAASHSSYDD